MTSKEYREKLEAINDYYSEGEDKIKNVIASSRGDDQKDLVDALEILSSLRYIATTNLKLVYVQGDQNLHD